MARKRKTEGRWYAQDAAKTETQGDVGQMREWLEILSGSEGVRLLMLSRGLGKVCEAILPATVETALKHGHTVLDIWVYANRLKMIPPFEGRKAKWEPAVAPANWVMDVDGVPGLVGDTPQERIDNLIKKMEANRCPLPKLFIETSPWHFHLLYTGTKAGEWTEARRYAVAERFAGMTAKPRTHKERDDQLKAAGVDPEYMRAKIDLAKFRLPGSVNVMKSNSAFDSSKPTIIVYGYMNPNHEFPSLELLGDLDGGYIKPTATARPAKPFPDAAWQRWVPYVRDAIEPFVAADMLDRIAEFLSKNYNMLKAKDCRIHQTTIAETMGIKQFALSRIIAKLKKDGILIETRTYAVGRYSKSYGCGLVLARCFRDAKADMRHRDVYKPYTPGNANTEFLKDIQHFVAVGTPLDEIVRIILEKQSDRPKDKVRGAKEIERAFFLWQNRPEGVSSETA